MLCFEVLGFVKILSIVLTLSRLWNCPTYQRNHKNKNLTGSKLLNNKSPEDILVGYTDILGISEIRTGAKMIYIVVGTDLFKQSGKGGWEEYGTQDPEANEQLKAWSLSLGHGLWSITWAHCLHQVDIFVVPKKNLPSYIFGGLLAYWIICLKRKSSSLGLWEVSLCACSLTWFEATCSATWQHRPLSDFFYCWKEMVKLSKQLKDVKNVYCHSCHVIPFSAEL